MNKNEKLKYNSKKEYVSINKQKVISLQKLNQKNQNSNQYLVNLDFYKPYKKYFFIPPQDYISQFDKLRKNKEDIFSKGRILTFTYNKKNNDNFYFDAIVEDFQKEENIYYCYIIPIKEKYRNGNYSDLKGNYKVKERSGDLTYIRMKDALNEFLEGYSCSSNLESLILGKNKNIEKANLSDLFDFNKYYMKKLKNFGHLTKNQVTVIDKIFEYDLNTIKLAKNSNIKIISFLINAIFEARKNVENKILICASSNTSADKIALELKKMNFYTKRMKLLRIYAKNQEIIERNKDLDEITFHKLIKDDKQFKKDEKKENRGDSLIKKSNVIISTCANSYCDELINYEFPFVIIVDANNSTENENIIPITLKSKHLVLISHGNNDNRNKNNSNNSLYKRMEKLYKESHFTL